MKYETPIKDRLLLRRNIAPGTSCWDWVGATVGGYGAINIAGKTRRVPRIAYEAWRGPIPAGLFVCHTCDNRRCFCPDHLFLGTNKDNVRDCISKGRFRLGRGSRQRCAKLTEADIPAIRELLAAGNSQREVAKQYGVTQATISPIAIGRTWAHVK
jgi:hypothetical protein